ncbi:GNAT family N-acetyltransferase [Flavobacteriaceae bacterium]|jgi:ribosomal protein S18 acetylase RimI-like enzyme|nr:GNAT family N-acetyltransferase [Flavobacteriaceae bacterium]
MSLLELIPVSIDDVKLLQKLSIQTFIETFGAQNTEADMQEYLNNQMSTSQLKKELEHAHSNFYFAYYKDRLAGYLKLNFESAQRETVGTGTAFEVERIYLLNDFQRQGLGKVLFEKAVALGKEKGYRKLWLGVWEHNSLALAFYKKLGLTVFDKHTFVLGSDSQTDLMLELDL